MDKLEAGTGVGQDSVLEVRVELVDTEPEIWRQFELRGSLALSPPARLTDGARRGPLEDSGGFPGYEESWMPWPTRRIHHAEHAAWVADITGSVAPFDPAFLDIPAVNLALVEQF